MLEINMGYPQGIPDTINKENYASHRLIVRVLLNRWDEHGNSDGKDWSVKAAQIWFFVSHNQYLCLSNQLFNTTHAV